MSDMSNKDNNDKIESSNGESCKDNSCGCGCGSGGFNAGRLLIIFVIILMAVYYFRVTRPVSVPDDWSADLVAAQKLASEENKHVLVAFHTSWCHFCTEMKNDVYPTEEFQKFADENLILVMLDGDRDTEAVAKYGVQGYPSYVVLAPDGSVKSVFAGYSKSSSFVTTIEKAIKS